jgi:hypothetical protein
MRSEQEVRGALERLGGCNDGYCGQYVYDDNPTIALGARHMLRWVLGDNTGLFGDHAEGPNIPVDGYVEGDELESFVQWAEAHGGFDEE